MQYRWSTAFRTLLNDAVPLSAVVPIGMSAVQLYRIEPTVRTALNIAALHICSPLRIRATSEYYGIS